MSGDKLPSICTSGSARVGNLFESVGSTIGGMFGFHHSSPLDKLKKEISQTKSDTQTVINTGIESFGKLQGDWDKDIYRDILTVNSALKSYIQLHDEILEEDIIVNKVYIFGSYILLLVVIIALYFTSSFLK